jgi:hypothetical protein
MLLRRLAAAVIAASLMPSAVLAEDDLPPELSPTRPLGEVAVMLAYQYCPQVLGGAMDVSGSWEVQQLGFEGDLLDRNEPEFDYPLFMLEATRFDGRLGFAGRVQNGCEVIVKGENRLAVRETLKAQLLALRVAFEPEPSLSSPNVEVYSATQGEQKFYARLKDTAGDDPETILQLSIDGCSTCRSTSNS